MIKYKNKKYIQKDTLNVKYRIRGRSDIIQHLGLGGLSFCMRGATVTVRKCVCVWRRVGGGGGRV